MIKWPYISCGQSTAVAYILNSHIGIPCNEVGTNYYSDHIAIVAT